jgi:hypothetical protein
MKELDAFDQRIIGDYGVEADCGEQKGFDLTAPEK